MYFLRNHKYLQKFETGKMFHCLPSDGIYDGKYCSVHLLFCCSSSFLKKSYCPKLYFFFLFFFLEFAVKSKEQEWGDISVNPILQ